MSLRNEGHSAGWTKPVDTTGNPVKPGGLPPKDDGLGIARAMAAERDLRFQQLLRSEAEADIYRVALYSIAHGGRRRWRPNYRGIARTALRIAQGMRSE